MKRKIWVILTLSATLFFAAGMYLIQIKNAQEEDVVNRNSQARERLENFEQEKISKTDETSSGVQTNTIFGEQQTVSINRVPGNNYGKLAIRQEDGTRKLLDTECERFHAAAGYGLCLKKSKTGHITQILTIGEKLSAMHQWHSALPSRARVSTDGKRASATMFTNGTSYQDVGAFTTIVEMIDLQNPKQTTRLHSYTYEEKNEQGNFWGVTFGKDGLFYVTYGEGNNVEILEGSTDTQTLKKTGIIGSCPSLSPDGTKLLFKKAMPDKTFQLAVLDLTTDEQTTINEPQSVDDQIEWLDNDTILYAKHTTETPATVQPEFDIWSIDISSNATPELYLPNADSPAMYQPSL